MRDEKLLIDPETGQEYKNVPVKIAAEYIGWHVPALYEALKQRVIPIGSSVLPTNGTKWSFCITPERLRAWVKGELR